MSASPQDQLIELLSKMDDERAMTLVNALSVMYDTGVEVGRAQGFQAGVTEASIAINSLKSLSSPVAPIAPLSMNIEDFRFTVRTYNCLKREDIFTIADLIKLNAKQLLDIRNFGQVSVEEVREALRLVGYKLRDD